MALSLRTVQPSQGARWVRDGFRLFGRHPIPFSLLFVVFLAALVISSIVPLIGAVVMLAAIPLLSLGFMVASESALQGGPIHPGQFITPLKNDATRRRSLLVLCAAYGAASLVILLLSDWVDGGAFDKLQRALAEAGDTTDEVRELASDPRLLWGMVVRVGLATLLAIPFWHAPALVHWGGQPPAQALFSSTLAVWRNKGAFVSYALAWCGVVAVFGIVTGVALSLLGMVGLMPIVALPAGLIFSTVFYVSLLFSFNDSFGGGSIAPTPDP